MRYSPPLVTSFRYGLRPPGDKSIAHRGVLLASLIDGKSRLREVPRSGDLLRTISSVRELGVEVDGESGEVLVGSPMGSMLQEPPGVIDCGGSGTTMRLLAGLLASGDFVSVLAGDTSLARRPMDRVIVPLREMGARIYGRAADRFAPLVLIGSRLNPIDYEMPVPSAQVKSSLLFAGLRGGVSVRIRERSSSRDHLEIMLQESGADIDRDRGVITFNPGNKMTPLDIVVPGDPSSASFFIVLALLVPDSSIRVSDVLLNPTRLGFVEVLTRMGARIELFDRETRDGEVVGDIFASSSRLRATRVGPDDIPSILDEVPVLAVAAARASGDTDFTGLGELRVKESDRITSIARNLEAIGVDVEEREDGFSVMGTDLPLEGAVNASGDHRIAMAFSILGASPGVNLTVGGAACVAKSFPAFYDHLQTLANGGEESTAV